MSNGGLLQKAMDQQPDGEGEVTGAVVVADVASSDSSGFMSARKSLFLVFNVVDQYVLTQVVRFCIENSATIDFAHLLNKGLQVIALVQHEGIDGDVLGGAASNSAQCLADSGGCWPPLGATRRGGVLRLAPSGGSGHPETPLPHYWYSSYSCCSGHAGRHRVLAQSH